MTRSHLKKYVLAICSSFPSMLRCPALMLAQKPTGLLPCPYCASKSFERRLAWMKNPSQIALKPIFQMTSRFSITTPFLIFLGCSLLFPVTGIACECPPTELSRKECDKYEVIFKGKILSVVDCDHKFGEVVFEVEELYKGNTAGKFKILFECKVPCAQKFSPGEEWIIYTRYKQIDNGKMEWCSRSRKFFRNANEDFYFMNYGNDYDDEVKFLRTNLGVHRVLDTQETVQNRNIRPNTTQTLAILLISIAVILAFYFLFNRFFK
jgi:hypothetical protein